MDNKLSVIITGASGMVGEGVIHESLNHPDFYNLSDIELQLKGYNTCFFCAGVSSVGMKMEEYTQVTYHLTLGFAATLSRLNKDMTFCYVSGAGTDGTEKGKMKWARVKGKTENDLQKLPFKSVYNFRPPFLLPSKGLKNVLYE